MMEELIVDMGHALDPDYVERTYGVTVTGRSAGKAGSTRTRYLHKDHIGSITVITDERAAIVEEFSFDAWGQRRAPGLARLEQLHNTPWNLMSALEQGNLSLAPALLASGVTNRGFTGHEQMDGVGLIHMNGRVYDARLGRFLSADPFIQDRTSSQALNRYSYVENNPLSYTDPSGYFLKKVFRKLKKLVGKVWKGIRTGLQGLFQGIGRVFNAVPGLSTVVGVVLSVVNPVAGALYFKVLAGLNAAVSLANGASIGDVATGFAVGLVTSGLGGALGDVLSKGIGVAGHYVAGGLTGGAAAKALGGRFKDGFAGGLLGAAARHVMGEFETPAEAEVEEVNGSKGKGGFTKNDELADNFSVDEDGNVVFSASVSADQGQEGMRDVFIRKVTAYTDAQEGFSVNLSVHVGEGMGDLHIASRSTMSGLHYRYAQRFSSSSYCAAACATTGSKFIHIGNPRIGGGPLTHEIFHNFGFRHSGRRSDLMHSKWSKGGRKDISSTQLSTLRSEYGL